MAAIGTKDFGHFYRGVTTNQGYYFNAVGTKMSGHYREVATHQGVGVPLCTILFVSVELVWCHCSH